MSSTIPPLETFILRPTKLFDIPTLAEHSVQAYWSNPITYIIAPKVSLYRSDFVRKTRQGLQARYFNPRNLGLVACLASSPDVTVGYGMFSRLGDDEGARSFVEEKKGGYFSNIAMCVLAWLSWAFTIAEKTLRPDRSQDAAVLKVFEAAIMKDECKYWTSHPERANRWHANGIVVNPQWQSRGIGRMILNEVLSRAQRECVPVGLTASPEGERLYRKMGFEMLGGFSIRVVDGDQGGMMIWYPQGTCLE